MKKLKYVVLLIYLALVGVFFYFTLRRGEESARESSFVADIVLKVLRFVTFKRIEFDYDIIHHITRKLVGHYGYNVLIGLFGFLTIYLFKKQHGNICLVISIVLGLVIAISGELLQYIPASRGPSIVDAMINFGGEVSGILISLLLFSWYKPILLPTPWRVSLLR